MTSKVWFSNPSISPPPTEAESVQEQALICQHISDIFYTTFIVEEQVGDSKNHQTSKMGDCLILFTSKATTCKMYPSISADAGITGA